MIVSRRAATAADTAFARRTHHAAYRDVVEQQFGSWDETRQDEFFATSWDPATHEIILRDGIPVGYCAIEYARDEMHLRELVISPAEQGRGVGTELLRQLQGMAQADAKPIRLRTFRHNRAQQLYARLGFVPINQTPTHIQFEWRATAEPSTSRSRLHD
jgi:N-acetylglutamate synthase-like GNAT family acetyltransferase